MRPGIKETDNHVITQATEGLGNACSSNPLLLCGEGGSDLNTGSQRVRVFLCVYRYSMSLRVHVYISLYVCIHRCVCVRGGDLKERERGRESSD